MIQTMDGRLKECPNCGAIESPHVEGCFLETLAQYRRRQLSHISHLIERDEMTKTQTDREKLRNDHLDSWIAVQPGDTIMGKIVDVTEAWSEQRRDPSTGRQGSLYPLLVIEAEEATGYDVKPPREFKVHCFGAVLFNEIMRKQPSVGERIRITYTGSGEAKPGQNAPELYTVRAAAGADVARRAYEKIGGGGTGPVQQPLDFDASDNSDHPF